MRDDSFAPVVFPLITREDEQRERYGVNNKPRQRYLMDQFVINLLPRAVERFNTAKVTAFLCPEEGSSDEVDRYINAFNEPTGSGMQGNVVKASNSLIKTRFSLLLLSLKRYPGALSHSLILPRSLVLCSPPFSSLFTSFASWRFNWTGQMRRGLNNKHAYTHVAYRLI